MLARRGLIHSLGLRAAARWASAASELAAAQSSSPSSPVESKLSSRSCSSSWVFHPSRHFGVEFEGNGDGGAGGGMSVQEAKRLIRQVNVQALKKQLQTRECPCIEYNELTGMCREMGLVESPDEAKRFVQAMDEAGEIVLFRNKVYLDPEEIAELVSRALPVHLIRDDDPRVKEFEELHDRKEAIDELADKQVRKFLWVGLLGLTGGTALFVRLTFWELSWDVMEPIAFFMTTSFIIAGYAYFLFSRRDPTYQGLMHSLLASRRRRLMRRMRFDYDRYKELHRLCFSTCKGRPSKDEDD